MSYQGDSEYLLFTKALVEQPDPSRGLGKHQPLSHFEAMAVSPHNETFKQHGIQCCSLFLCKVVSMNEEKQQISFSCNAMVQWKYVKNIYKPSNQRVVKYSISLEMGAQAKPPSVPSLMNTY